MESTEYELDLSPVVAPPPVRLAPDTQRMTPEDRLADLSRESFTTQSPNTFRDIDTYMQLLRAEMQKLSPIVSISWLSNGYDEGGRVVTAVQEEQYDALHEKFPGVEMRKLTRDQLELLQLHEWVRGEERARGEQQPPIDWRPGGRRAA